MIYDKLENIGMYVGSDSDIARAVDFAKAFTDGDGRYHIDGEKMYANVETYQTGPENDKLFESHRKYIDVQIMLSGSEMHGVIPLNEENLTVLKPYDQEKDLVFYGTICDYSRVILATGEFVIYFPQDCHKPGCQLNNASTVRKMVVKIAI